MHIHPPNLKVAIEYLSVRRLLTSAPTPSFVSGGILHSFRSFATSFSLFSLCQHFQLMLIHQETHFANPTFTVREFEFLTSWTSVEDDDTSAVVKTPISRRLSALSGGGALELDADADSGAGALAFSLLGIFSANRFAADKKIS
jgi:hypothetical protein